ncbi:MAG TPA: hypothetical protein VN083_10760, partial [Vicinamibacteria bacterium]|nr:hypothetical protein [Vicinamibacteria bacterium]
LVAWGSARLLGPRTGLLALLAIGLSYHENGAPFVPWLALLIFTAILGAVAEGFLRTLARWGWWVSVVALILALAPFYRDQIRVALFPATGELSMRPAKAADALQGLGYLGARQAAPAAPPLPRSAPAEEAARPSGYAGKPRVERKDKDKVLAETVSVQAASSTNARLEEDVHAVLQTGPGIPNWSWQSYALAWSGPVSPDHPMRLFLLSPRGNLLLTVVRLLALALLLGRFAGRARDIGWKAPPAAAILLLLMMTAPLARAQSKDEGSSYPSPALLEDLRKRLTRPEACEPECVTTASVVLRATQSALSLLAEVHAAARGAWAIPGPVGSWVPAEVQVDGEKSPPIVRSEDGFLRVRVGPGVHRVEVTGPIPRQDTLTLEFKDRPRHGSAEAPGWEVTGLHPDGPADAQVSLTRRLGTTSDSEGRIYPPWLEITRTVTIRASWRVSTTLRRVSPTGSPVSVKVPLLPGESPTKSGLEVRNGEVQVGLGRDEEEQEWESTLKPVPNGAPLSLEAPQGRPWSEVWTVECGVPVACEAKGIPPVSWQGEGGVRALTFRPWPGEKVALFAGRPEGAPGQTLTVDSLEIADEPGARLESVVLKAQVRASRDGALDLQLPARADVQEVKVGDQPQASRPQGGRLHLTIGRGSQPVLVRWHEDRGMAFAYSAPRVGVDGGATNVTTTVAVPENRWLLFVSGPAWGPAVLFWGYLLLASIVAYLLGRIPGSPLSSLEWWLLSLGLTQTSGTLAALVVGFFFVLAWRGRNRIADPLRHNLLEILLVVWALVALAGLESAVEAGLLLRPEMQVAGGGSTGTLLRWYTDRIVDVSPGERLVSLPLWVYRLVMFAWSFWLVVSLVRWVAWGWRCATEGGAWRLPFLGRRPKSPGTP